MMFYVQFLTTLLIADLPNRVAYLPVMLGETDTASDITGAQNFPEPNTVLWEARICAATLDRWLTDANVFLLSYEAINEPV